MNKREEHRQGAELYSQDKWLSVSHVPLGSGLVRHLRGTQHDYWARS